jgi:hypothetical protein
VPATPVMAGPTGPVYPLDDRARPVGPAVEPVGSAKWVRLRCLRILVDKSTEEYAPSDRGSCRRSGLRRRFGRPLTPRAVRTVLVVVRRVLGKDGRQVAFADDEHPVGAFPPYGAYPAFRDCVGPRRQLHPIWTIDADGCG